MSSFRGTIGSGSPSAGTNQLSGYGETFDTGNNFNPTTGVFTAPVAGQYIFTATAHLVTAGDYRIDLYVNGSKYTYGGRWSGTSTNPISNVVGIVNMASGSTADVRIVNAASGSSLDAEFSGSKLDGNVGSGGGTATPAGITKDVQFNTAGALDADTGYFGYDKTNHRLGVGMVTPTSTLQVSGTFTVSTSTQTTTPSLYSAGGNLSIGTTSQNARLMIAMDGSAQSGLSISDTQSGGREWRLGPGAGTGSAAQFNFYDATAAATRVTFSSGGSVGIANTSPIAKLDVNGTISASDAIQVSGSSLTCSSTIKGAIRYSNTSSTLEYCNSTAWTSLGPSATSVPAFSVHKNGTNQTISSGTWTKLTWSTELFDTNNNFTSDRFTPTVSGKYIIALTVTCSDGTQCFAGIYKNGSQFIQSGTNERNVTSIVELNGTTDYVEGYGWNTGGTTIDGAAVLTRFTGTLIASGNGLAGGATPGGSDQQVQFNDGGTTLGGDSDYTWNKTTNKLTINGDIEYTGVTRDTSDRRLKTDITALPANMLDKIMLMKPVSFHMRDNDRGKELGFIAQDVEQLFPDLVGTAKDTSGTKSLNYVGLIAPTIKALQELKADNDNLRAELQAANENFVRLERQVQVLRRTIAR